MRWSPQWSAENESCWGNISLQCGCFGFLLSLGKVNLFKSKSPSLGEVEEEVATLHALSLGYFFDLLVFWCGPAEPHESSLIANMTMTDWKKNFKNWDLIFFFFSF